MIRILMLFLVALALGAAAALYLRADSGYVLVNYGPWILETSLLGFIAATVLLVLVVIYGTRLVVTLFRLPELFRGALGSRRDRLARQSFEAGLRKLLGGHWKKAEVELVRRAADHHESTLNYLLAARAADRSGAPDRREHYLELAGSAGENETFLAGVVRAELLLEQQQQTTALKILEELHRRDPEHPRAIELLAEAQSRAGDWDSLRALLSSVERRGIFNPARYAELMEQALTGLLKAAATTARMDAMKSVWESAPVTFRQRAAVRRAYVAGLVKLGAESEAAAQITAALKQDWDGVLVHAYGRLEGIDPLTQLANVEAWLGKFGEEADLLRTAGRVCIRNRLWGKARSYLEAALRREPTAEIYYLLAKLCEETRNTDDAQKFNRLGLELAAK